MAAAMPLFNYLCEENEPQIIDCSSQMPQTSIMDLFTSERKELWVSLEGLPQYFVIDFSCLKDRPRQFKSFGFDCWHDYQTNPKVIELSVSPDNESYVNWAILHPELVTIFQIFKILTIRGPSVFKEQKSGIQIFAIDPISTSYNFLRVTIRETFGAAKTYMNQIFLLGEVPSQEPPEEMNPEDYEEEEIRSGSPRTMSEDLRYQEEENENENEMEFLGEEMPPPMVQSYIDSQMQMDRRQAPETFKSQGGSVYQNIESVAEHIPRAVYEGKSNQSPELNVRKQGSRPRSEAEPENRNDYEEIVSPFRGVDQSSSHRNKKSTERDEEEKSKNRSVSRESALTSQQLGINQDHASERPRRAGSSRSHKAPLHPNGESWESEQNKREKGVEKIIEEKLGGFEGRILNSLAGFFSKGMEKAEAEKNKEREENMRRIEKMIEKKLNEAQKNQEEAFKRKENEEKKNLNERRAETEPKENSTRSNKAAIPINSKAIEANGDSKYPQYLASCKQKLNYEDTPASKHLKEENEQKENEKMEARLRAYIDQQVSSLGIRIESLLQKTLTEFKSILENERKNEKKTEENSQMNKGHAVKILKENGYSELVAKSKLMEEEIEKYQKTEEKVEFLAENLGYSLEEGLKKVETNLERSLTEKFQGIEKRVEEYQQSNELFKERVVDEMANIIQMINKMAKTQDLEATLPKKEEKESSRLQVACCRLKEAQNEPNYLERPIQISQKQTKRKPEGKPFDLKGKKQPKAERVMDLFNALQEKLAIKVKNYFVRNNGFLFCSELKERKLGLLRQNVLAMH